MTPTAALLALILSVEAGPDAAPAEDRPYELGAELGVAESFGPGQIFDHAATVGGSVLRSVLPRLDAGLFVAYRQVLNTEAASFWYADVGVRARFVLLDRLSIRVDAGWTARHIGVESGYSNTVGGFMAGAGLAMNLFIVGNWRMGVVAAYHRNTRSAELFWTQDVGVAIHGAWRR